MFKTWISSKENALPQLTQLILGRPYKGLILNMLNVPYDGPILIFEKLSFQIE